jgi:hypothetical protein
MRQLKFSQKCQNILPLFRHPLMNYRETTGTFRINPNNVTTSLISISKVSRKPAIALVHTLPFFLNGDLKRRAMGRCSVATSISQGGTDGGFHRWQARRFLWPGMLASQENNTRGFFFGWQYFFSKKYCLYYFW